MTLPTQPDLATASDRAVVGRARQGVDDAYRELVRRYRDRVIASVFRVVRHRERAEDLAQETFVKAFAALDHFRSERRLAPWLLKIATNAANEYVSRVRPDSPLSRLALTPTHLDRDALPIATADPTGAPGDTPTAQSDSRARGLQEALNGLRWDFRQCVILRHIEQRSHEEIAAIMQVPVGTVKSHLVRARKQLRSMIGRDGA
jgi:RNA polymerase sigma-70 factor (ECF subfamily)